jgi:F-type H+-transporting ATPase subunit a
LMVWVIYNGVGIKHQGLGGYLKSTLFPPGVPKALYILVTPIELISTFLVRPFSLAVRLFANMLAGHIVIFFLLGLIFMLGHPAVAFVSVPFALGIYLLELFVAFVQAYVFTMLSALFIGMSVAMGHHHDHGHAEDHGHGHKEGHNHDHGKAHMLG